MSPQGSIFIWHVSQQNYLVPNDIINARKFYSLLSATTDNVCEKRVSEVDIHERKEETSDNIYAMISFKLSSLLTSVVKKDEE